MDNNALGEHLEELCVLLSFSLSQFFCAFLVCLAVICDFFKFEGICLRFVYLKGNSP